MMATAFQSVGGAFAGDFAIVVIAAPALPGEIARRTIAKPMAMI